MSDQQNLEYLLSGVQAKGNGFIVGTVAEDGRVVPFALLRVRLGQRRCLKGIADGSDWRNGTWR
jgi:hypothetical protein